MEVTTVDARATTALPPCCLRIFHGRFVLVGTYELDKPSGHRTGSVDVYNQDLELLHTYPTYGAVLDLKLSPHDETLVATAHSTGNIMLWKVDASASDDDITLELVSNLLAFETDTLVSSLHFSPLDAGLVCATTTTGEAATFDMATGSQVFNATVAKQYSESLDVVQTPVQGKEETGRTVVVDTFDEVHDLECWTAEFGQLSPLQNVLFTGGDDSTIMAHDLRTHGVIWRNGRIHEAGVVGIKCSSQTFRTGAPTSIITGSYDDNIRALDLRMLGEDIYPGRNTPAAQVCQQGLGGGVWRFSEVPAQLKTDGRDRLMVCCMYDGAKVLTLDEASAGTEQYFQVDSFLKQGHESMCYGGDWSGEFIATCSFYDKSLQKWHV
ncbi:diphthamide synthase [Maudiozyma humilis]|uniref:methylated diphthine methylhydrolase n=1 Tax=Maudiozyma humilis TaxID=51915 RepID=A0AAV5S3C4_MAUHU|nr:diphthamide synthase [Kazachstania humilis]